MWSPQGFFLQAKHDAQKIGTPKVDFTNLRHPPPFASCILRTLGKKCGLPRTGCPLNQKRRACFCLRRKLREFPEIFQNTCPAMKKLRGPALKGCYDGRGTRWLTLSKPHCYCSFGYIAYIHMGVFFPLSTKDVFLERRGLLCILERPANE